MKDSNISNTAVRAFLALVSFLLWSECACADEKRDVRGITLGSSDFQSILNGMDEVYCRKVEDKVLCVDNSSSDRNGQRYEVDLNSQNRVFGVGYTFCAVGVSTMDLIMNMIIKSYDIKPGAQMIDTKKPSTLVFDGSTQGTGDDVGLYTNQTCLWHQQKGMSYTLMLVNKQLRDAK